MADPLLDSVLRFRLRLDGVAADTAGRLADEIDSAILAVDRELRRDAGDNETMSHDRLIRARRELLLLKDDLEARLDSIVEEAGQSVAEAARLSAGQASGLFLLASFGARAEKLAAERGLNVFRSLSQEQVEEVLDEALDALDVAEEVLDDLISRLAALDELIDSPFELGSFNGKPWRTWSGKLNQDAIDSILRELHEALAEGDRLDDVTQRLAKVGATSRNAAATLADTMAADVGQRAQIESFEALFGDALAGWRYVATLDGRTSEICRGLDGMVFAVDAPDLPRPPRHPRCRSVLVPLTDLSAKPAKSSVRPWVRSADYPDGVYREYRALAKSRVGADAWKAMSKAQRYEEIKTARADWQSKNIGQAWAGTNYETWLRRQPAAFAREVLGPTRYSAWSRGLPLERMATYSRRLTLDELSRLYPKEMQR
jgi:SPP1 gp7 family putative phage head morphogenesis protein